jgi:hypothetical protein
VDSARTNQAAIHVDNSHTTGSVTVTSIGDVFAVVAKSTATNRGIIARGGSGSGTLNVVVRDATIIQAVDLDHVFRNSAGTWTVGTVDSVVAVTSQNALTRNGRMDIPQLATAGVTFPTADGTSGQVLQTNGAGVATWVTPAGGGPGTITVAASATRNLLVSESGALVVLGDACIVNLPEDTANVEFRFVTVFGEADQQIVCDGSEDFINDPNSLLGGTGVAYNQGSSNPSYLHIIGTGGGGWHVINASPWATGP